MYSEDTLHNYLLRIENLIMRVIYDDRILLHNSLRPEVGVVEEPSVAD